MIHLGIMKGTLTTLNARTTNINENCPWKTGTHGHPSYDTEFNIPYLRHENELGIWALSFHADKSFSDPQI